MSSNQPLQRQTRKESPKPTNLPSADPSSKHITRRAKPPLHSISFNRFIYILGFLALVLAGYYCYKIVQLERKLVVQPLSRPTGTIVGASIQDKINDLAAVLGIPAKDLASAVAAAVREHSTSMPASASKETGEFVQQQLDGERGRNGGFRDVLESLIKFDETAPDVVRDANGL